MENRFLEMEGILKRQGYKSNGVAKSFTGPPVLQDITHAGPYRIAYDRLSTLGVIEPLPGRDTRKFRGTAELQTTLNSWTPYLDRVLRAPAYILTGGLTVNKPGEHSMGNAIDIDGFWWSDTEEFLAINAPSDWFKYIKIEATLRKVFGTVLNYDYNADHHNHWHCDLGGNTTWRAVRSQVLFAQRALNVIWQESLTVDGNWGPASNAAAIRNGYNLSAPGGWDHFLDDIINRQSSGSNISSKGSDKLNLTKSLSNEKRSTNLITQQGINLIKSFEGFRSTMYNDPVGHCTIGYGTLIHRGNCNGDSSEQPFRNGVSDAQATQLLVDRLNEFQLTVNNSVTVELNAGQFDSLVSFTYNVGPGNFRSSTLLRLLNQGNYNVVPSELRKWTKGSVNGRLVDLPGLVRRRNAEADLFAASSTSVAQSVYDNYSKPFYDTGEHAMLGEFINDVVSGPLANVYQLSPTTYYNIKTVPFTYGQIMTLADFYESYDWIINNASATELTGLKKMIEQNENYYKNIILGSRLSDTKDPSNDEWDSATSGRYIDLALKNNSHFAPNISGGSTTTNNKETWERYHRKAIDKARSGISSDAMVEALSINAFGDHFLTDAFSAGHLINKEQVIKEFLGNVLTNGRINSAGDKLMEKIAAEALKVPLINSMLGQYEVVPAHWYSPAWDLNDTGWLYPEVFYRVLIRVLESDEGRPQVAGLAVKAVHDYLNTYRGGVPVKNNIATQPEWKLTGDTTLNKDNIKIIQLAVKQSVENIMDCVTNPTIPHSTYFKKVWDHVPDLNYPPTSKIVAEAIKKFTTPTSEDLVKKSVSLLTKELDILIKKLVEKGAVRKIPRPFPTGILQNNIRVVGNTVIVPAVAARMIDPRQYPGKTIRYE